MEEAPEDTSSGTFVPPTVDRALTLQGDSYTYFSPVPAALQPPTDSSSSTPSATTTPSAAGPPCVLGVDEAGRGPVLGPMVYGVFYLPTELSTPLLKDAHHFDDSKALTAVVRSDLMRALCSASPTSDDGEPEPALRTHCGFATSSLSPRAISSGMQRPPGAAPYNLNAQAEDATVSLIRGVLDRGVNVREVFVDTVGPPVTYQARLQRAFPSLRVVVAKKADSLYPCVSAASVVAKVTRDAALETLWDSRPSFRRQSAKRKASAAPAAALESGKRSAKAARTEAGAVDKTPEDQAASGEEDQKSDEAGEAEVGGKEEAEEEEEVEEEVEEEEAEASWGSGYPSDARCVAWLRRNMHPLFGWGPECRFSWGTARDLLDPPTSSAAAASAAVRVEWPADDDEAGNNRLTDFFVAGKGGGDDATQPADELGSWFGAPVGLEAF